MAGTCSSYVPGTWLSYNMDSNNGDSEMRRNRQDKELAQEMIVAFLMELPAYTASQTSIVTHVTDRWKPNGYDKQDTIIEVLDNMVKAGRLSHFNDSFKLNQQGYFFPFSPEMIGFDTATTYHFLPEHDRRLIDSLKCVYREYEWFIGSKGNDIRNQVFYEELGKIFQYLSTNVTVRRMESVVVADVHTMLTDLFRMYDNYTSYEVNFMSNNKSLKDAMRSWRIDQGAFLE